MFVLVCVGVDVAPLVSETVLEGDLVGVYVLDTVLVCVCVGVDVLDLVGVGV